MKLLIFVMMNYSIIQIFASCAIVVIVAVIVWLKFSKKKYKLPPGLTVFTSLGPEPYIELDNLKKKYGKVFRYVIFKTLVYNYLI